MEKEITDLLKLLRDYITPEEYEELLRRLIKIIDDPKLYIPLLEYLRELLAKYINGPNGATVKNIIEAIIKKIPKPPPLPPGSWWKFGVRLGVYLALVYLLGAAIYDSTVKQKPLGGGKGPCSIAAGIKPMSVNPSAVGPNAALRDALDELEKKCNLSGLNCSGSSCPTCAPDISVQTVNIKCRIFWYTAEVTANCQCWCK